MPIVLTILIALFSLFALFWLTFKSVQKIELEASFYRNLIQHGVHLTEALKQSRHDSMENIEQLYDAIKGWEKRVCAVTQDLNSKQTTKC